MEVQHQVALHAKTEMCVVLLFLVKSQLGASKGPRKPGQVAFLPTLPLVITRS